MYRNPANSPADKGIVQCPTGFVKRCFLQKETGIFHEKKRR